MDEGSYVQCGTVFGCSQLDRAMLGVQRLHYGKDDGPERQADSLFLPISLRLVAGWVFRVGIDYSGWIISL